MIKYLVLVLLLCGCIEFKELSNTEKYNACFGSCFDETYPDKTAYNACRDKCINTIQGEEKA